MCLPNLGTFNSLEEMTKPIYNSNCIARLLDRVVCIDFHSEKKKEAHTFRTCFVCRLQPDVCSALQCWIHFYIKLSLKTTL